MYLQLNDLEQGIGLNNATTLNNLASSLNSSTAQLSQGNGLTVGNLNASVNLIQRLAGIHNAGQPASGDEIQVCSRDGCHTMTCNRSYGVIRITRMSVIPTIMQYLFIQSVCLLLVVSSLVLIRVIISF